MVCHIFPQIEGSPDKSQINSVENLAPVSYESHSSWTESSSILGSESEFNDSKTEVGTSYRSSNGSSEDDSGDYGLRNIDAGNPSKSVSESKESVSYQAGANCNCKEAILNKNVDMASTSYEEQPHREPVFANSRIGLDATSRADNSANTTVPLFFLECLNSSSVAQEHPAWDSVENHEHAVMGPDTSASVSHSVFSDSLTSLQLFGDDTAQVAIPPGSGLLMSDSDLDLQTGSVLHVDVVSISSTVLSSSVAEISNREARRNSRRLFWDALSRRSFRRHNDSPVIVFTTGHADDIGSHDRWLLDLSGDLHYDGVGRELGYMGTGRHRRSERRWESRFEVRFQFSIIIPKYPCRIFCNLISCWSVKLMCENIFLVIFICYPK